MVALLKTKREIELLPLDEITDGVDVLSRAFDEILEPLYGGSKVHYLEKILFHQDRTCEILQERGKSVGVLVYKNHLTSEFSEYGITDAFEIKSLFLTRPKKNSHRGLASQMLARVAAQATKMEASMILATVNSSVIDSVMFFLRNSFLFAQREMSKYLPSTYEYLLVHQDPPDLLEILS